MDLIRELLDRELLWRFQLSISTPQPGTPFFNRMKEQGQLKDVDWKHFDGGNHVVVNRPEYPAEKIMEKWAPLLDAEGVDPIKDAHRRSVTAVLLENQARQLIDEASRTGTSASSEE